MGTSSGMVDTTLSREVQKHEQSSFGTLTKYDVFLNHRGPDLKRTFVSHLNKALQYSGREPFWDAKALVKGQNAFGSISEALSGVLVHVAIFSRRYAESKYCLNELCDMLASGKPLIPVFYDVEPENLRQTGIGPFAEAFRAHLKKGREQDVVKWKAALVQVAAITGFKLVDCDNDTVKLEEKIVAAVSDALSTRPTLAPARHLVGLKESSGNVINMLHKMGDSIGVVGIWGMGGIGKTTLAREVYNKEHANFGSLCFLSDVKEATGVAVKDLQMQMVIDLLHVDAKKMQWNFARWFDQIRNHRHKMFLVVDDITRREQLDQLVPNLRELPPGSRVLITSRESGVLKNIMLDVAQSVLYPVPELSFSESLDLFLWSAFRRNGIDSVDASVHDFVRAIVKACDGLPLALEVMGGFLADKTDLPNDEKYWEEATLALRRSGDIITSLRMSYDGLMDEDKLMFLDIACFMLGHHKKVALEVWDSRGVYGSSSWSLRRLIDKCLVEVDFDGRLSMQDLLRDMGRNIVLQRASYEPEMQSHIWDPLIAAKVLQKMQDDYLRQISRKMLSFETQANGNPIQTRPPTGGQAMKPVNPAALAMRDASQSLGDGVKRRQPAQQFSFLKLTKECLEAVEKMPSWKFNNEQCDYLVEKLKLIIQCANLFLEVSLAEAHEAHESVDFERYTETFKLLLALANQIKSFGEGCCKDAWIQAAMTLTNVAEHVSSIGSNLELCRLAFSEKRAAFGCLTLDQVVNNYNAEVEVVKRKASADVGVLLAKLTLELNSSKGGNRDLASYLLQRLIRVQANHTPFTSGSLLSDVNDDEISWGRLFKWVKPAKHLGKGAAATVHKATWLGIQVAKKTFQGPENPDFMKEVGILGRLCHPNITSMFCCAKGKHWCAIVMELMDEDLHDLIQRRCDENNGSPPFPIFEAIDIMLQIGEGVNYLHTQKIVHRDLKSFNILVKSVKAKRSKVEYVHAKVADFGLSKTKESSIRYSNQTYNTGTHRWMAPEIINLNVGFGGYASTSEPKFPFKCDVYSFAMVCYEILTGFVPFFEETSFKKIKEQVLGGRRPDLPDYCPPLLKALIKQCWNQEPNERPTFAFICLELKYLKYLLMTGIDEIPSTSGLAQSTCSIACTSVPAATLPQPRLPKTYVLDVLLRFSTFSKIPSWNVQETRTWPL